MSGNGNREPRRRRILWPAICSVAVLAVGGLIQYAGVGVSSAAEAHEKTITVTNHGYYDLNASAEAENRGKTLAEKRDIFTGKTWQDTATVYDDDHVVFHFEAVWGQKWTYDAGRAADAPDEYCFETFGTTLSLRVSRTDCATGNPI